jgi:DNA processing protein
MLPYDAPSGALAPRAPSPDLTIGARLIDRRNATARRDPPNTTARLDRRNAPTRLAGPQPALAGPQPALAAPPPALAVGQPALTARPTVGAREATPPPAGAPQSPPDETAAMLLLLQTGTEDPSAYAAIVERAGSAHTVLLNERLRAAPQTSFFADPERDLDAELDQAHRELSGWRAQGMQMLTVLDPGYPDALRSAQDRPPLLFVAGRLKPRDERAVAIVGAGVSTPDGEQMAAEIASGLVARRFTVVGGLDVGADTAAHEAALKRGGRTIAVAATGLARCYPRTNAVLQRRIAAQCAVISQFLPLTPADRHTFLSRASVISGISLAIVVIEAAGARHQVACALEQGRPVFAPETELRHRWLREAPQVRTFATADELLCEIEAHEPPES